MDLSSSDQNFPKPPISFLDKTQRQITIKPYQGSPDALVDMYLAYEEPATRGLPPQTEEEIRDWLETYTEQGENIIARHNWQILGHAALLPHGNSAELVIFVHPEEQSKGIGSELIKALLGHGQAKGIENVWLSVDVDNLSLIRITTAVGFNPPENSHVEFKLSRDL